MQVTSSSWSSSLYHSLLVSLLWLKIHLNFFFPLLLICPLFHFIWCFHGSSFSHSRQVFGEKYVEIVFASTSSSFTVNGLQVIKYITFRSIYYGYKKKLSFFSTIISTGLYICKCLHIIILVRFFLYHRHFSTLWKCSNKLAHCQESTCL